MDLFDTRGATGQRALAGAVMLQAIKDCREEFRINGLEGLHRSEAHGFLTQPSKRLEVFCGFLQLDQEVVAERMRNAMATEEGAKGVFATVTTKQGGAR